MIFLSARILLRRGDIDAAKSIMSKVYAHATPQQVDLKVCAQTYLLFFAICLNGVASGDSLALGRPTEH